MYVDWIMWGLTQIITSDSSCTTWYSVQYIHVALFIYVTRYTKT